MAKQKKQRFEGIVYSTDSDFDYSFSQEEATETLPAKQQKLRIELDRKSRKGKTITLITGFVGRDEDLQDLAKSLKQKCGVGGSAKDGEILIQGDFKLKIFDILKSLDYQVKLVGG